MEPTTTEPTIWPTFQDYYDLYDKKRGRPNAEKYWARLTQKEKEDCMAAVPAYLQSTPDKKYRKDPERYLRHKAFYDEVVAAIPINGTVGQGSAVDAKKRAVFEAFARRRSGAGVDTDQGH